MSKHVPAGWQDHKINDIIAFSASGEWGDPPKLDEYDIPVLRSTNFTNHGKVNYSDVVIRNINARKLNDITLRQGDILLEKSGGSPKQPVGRVVYFNSTGKYTFANFLHLLRLDSSVDSLFACYLFNFNYTRGDVLRYQQQTTGIINFRLKEYLEEVLLLPPLPEQRKIATVLSSADRSISVTEKLIAKLADLKKALMQQLLTKGIGHTEFKPSLLGPIPKSWEVVEFEYVAKIQGGYAFKSTDAVNNGARWLKIANVGTGTIKWEEKSFLPNNFIAEHKEYILKVNDIVIAMTRPVLGNVLKVAKVSRFDCNSLLNQRVGRVKIIQEKVDNEFIYQIMSQRYFADAIETTILGTDPPNVSSRQIESIMLPLPPLSEQRKIAGILSTVDRKLSAAKVKLAKAKNLKQGLMNDLLTGKVRVSA